MSPDAGGVERARAIAKRLHAGLAIIDKRREGPNVATVMHLIGDVAGKEVVVIDDMIDTAGTLRQAVGALEREGAKRILACGVHAVLSGPAIERIKGSALEEVVVTNSIPVPPVKGRRASLSSASPRSSARRSGGFTTKNPCRLCSSEGAFHADARTDDHATSETGKQVAKRLRRQA